MKNVLVILSTYNGEKYLREQIESVLKQENVKISILVRDDGSTDNTCNILEEYEKKGLLRWYTGKNLKPAKSFIDLIFHATNDFDYYAFCDQDDFWYFKKIYSAIEQMENNNDSIDIPKVCYCNLEVVDSDRNLLETKKIHKRCEYDEEMILTYCIPGCAMVFNQVLLNILQKHKPSYATMHDCWVYYVCMAVGGKIYGNEKVGIQYRQHGNNVIGASRIAFKQKMKMIIGNGNSPRQRMISEILRDFDDDLEKGTKLEYLKAFSEYSNSVLKKIKIMRIKRKMAPKRTFIKAKLRVLFNSL